MEVPQDDRLIHDPPPKDPGFPARRPLPLDPRGRPVWFPPDLDYSRLIGDEYAKMRKAVLEFTGGDVAKATEFLDWDIEYTLTEQYERWAESMVRDSERFGNQDSRVFYNDLRKELAYDGRAFFEAGYARMGTIMGRFPGSDEYFIECHDPYAPMWGGDPRIVQKAADCEAVNERMVLRIKAEREAAAVEEAAQRPAEKEQMLRSNQFMSHPKQPITSIPLILQMLDSCKNTQESEASPEDDTREEDVD